MDTLSQRVFYLPLIALGLAVVVAPGSAEAAQYTFCLKYPDEEWYDASIRQDVDFGEDVGRNVGDWSVPYILTTIKNVTGGATVYSGWVASNGCSTSFSSTSDKFNVYYSPYYYSSGNAFALNIFDCPGGANCTFPQYVILNYNPPAASGSYNVILPGGSHVMTAYLSAAYVIIRFMGNIYNGDPAHFISLWHTGPGAGGITGTQWHSGGYPLVQLGSTAARSKFTVAHEFGHALMMDRIQDWYEVDCSFGSGGQYNHTMNGQEYASCASTEGFAHFVAAATWNYTYETNGVYVIGNPLVSLTSVHDAEIGSNEILNHCVDCTGYGVEHDWLRFLWDFRTNAGTQPTSVQILDVYEGAHPWSTSVDHYAELEASASDLGFSLSLRWAELADYNGVNW